MLFREYDEETLSRLQALELMILRDFIDLCESGGIDYFGVGGTAIGAVRHGGFIPWDDDIDVGLTRENYERFLEAARDYKPEKYKLVNAQTDSSYPLPTTRWVLRGTKFKEECFQNLDCELGIFLDIYCFDNIADDDGKMRRQGWKAWFYGKLLILRSISKPVLYVKGWKAGLVLAASFFVHHGLRIFRVSPGFLYRKAMEAASAYRDVPTKRVAYFFDPTPFTSIIQMEHIVPTKIMDFNGIPMRFPGKVEEYLKVRYGDYRSLPPVEERHNHPPAEFDFGPYEEVEKFAGISGK